MVDVPVKDLDPLLKTYWNMWTWICGNLNGDCFCWGALAVDCLSLGLDGLVHEIIEVVVPRLPRTPHIFKYGTIMMKNVS